MHMTRGTTPTITVNLDVAASSLSALFLTIRPLTGAVIEKTLTDGVKSDNSVAFTLSQADTLALMASTTADIQARGRIGDHAFASPIITVDVGAIIKDGEI